MRRKQLSTLDHPLLLVVVKPILTRLKAGYDRMPRCRRMPRRMLARRTVTASDVPALRTPAEMKPPTFRRRQAFNASIATWLRSRINSTTSFFHVRFSVSMSHVAAMSSRHQQDLPDAALFCRCLSLGRFTERHLPANRDHHLAISHRFGHELEVSSVEFREDRHHLYRWILRGVLRCPEQPKQTLLPA